MPRPTLPAELSRLHTYSVCLTQTTEEDLMTHFRSRFETFEEDTRVFLRKRDRFIESICEHNPYKNVNWSRGVDRIRSTVSFMREEEVLAEQNLALLVIDLKRCTRVFSWTTVANWVEMGDDFLNRLRDLDEELKQVEAIAYQSAHTAWKNRPKPAPAPVIPIVMEEEEVADVPETVQIPVYKPLAVHTCESCAFKTYGETLMRQHTESREHKKVVRAKMLYCETCKHTARCEAEAEHHKQSKKHRIACGDLPPEPEQYTCEKCAFSTPHKQVYQTHCKSKKHNA